MNLSGVKPDDIVMCDVRGDRFFAQVGARNGDGSKLPITSLTGRPIPALQVSARQVVGHWRKSKQSKV